MRPGGFSYQLFQHGSERPWFDDYKILEPYFEIRRSLWMQELIRIRELSVSKIEAEDYLVTGEGHDLGGNKPAYFPG